MAEVGGVYANIRTFSGGEQFPNASGEKKQKEINNRKRNYEQFSQQYARQHYNEKADVTKVRRNSASSFNNTDIP